MRWFDLFSNKDLELMEQEATKGHPGRAGVALC
jgi:hypothetical protein